VSGPRHDAGGGSGLATATVELTPRPHAVFAAGVAASLGERVREEARSVLVVTDPGVRAAGVCDPVLASLRDVGLAHELFDGISVNPTVDEVEAGILAARELSIDVVVGVGGGACLDVAKAVALGAANHVPVLELDYRSAHLRPGLRVVAVPTTAGTGSETNGFGVIGDPAAHAKVYLGNATVQPRLALLDPLLTASLPPAATAAAGMDALAHAVESLAARNGNPYAEAVALGVAQAVAVYLPRAVADGGDREARAQLLLAAHVAGHAQQTTGLGIAHAIAHALSAHLGLPHGIACAAALPPSVRYNRAVRADVYARLATALGAADGDAAAAIAALEQRVGLGGGLAERGLTSAVAKAVAESAAADVVLVNNPRGAGAADILGLLEEVR
jgi:alcohol dehydrogenase class IV